MLRKAAFERRLITESPGARLDFWSPAIISILRQAASKKKRAPGRPLLLLCLDASIVGFRLVILFQLLLHSVRDGVVVAEFHREAALALAHALEFRVVITE